MSAVHPPKWLAPPIFPGDDERTRAAALVHAVLVLTFTMTVIGSVAGGLLGPSGGLGFLPGLAIIVMELIAIFMVRAGHVRAGAWTLTVLLWLGITGVSVVLGGINGATITLFTVTILVAGMVTGWRGNLFATFASVITLTVFFALERSGNPLPMRMGESTLNVWITTMVNVVATSLLLNIALQQLNSAIRTSRQRERDLQTTLDELRRTSFSKDYVDSIFNSMLDMLLVLDEDLRIVTVNHAAADQLDYYEAELIGKHLYDVLHTNDPTLLQRVAALLTAEDVDGFQTTTHCHTRDGVLIPVDFTVSRLRVRSADKRIVCVARDVTDRVRANVALQRSERRLRIAIDNVNAILFTLDMDGVFTSSEGKGLGAIGLAPGAVVGRSAFDYYAHLPGFVQDIRRALRGESFSSTRDLVGMVFESYFTPMLDENGTMTGVIGFSINVTDRVQAERALAQERNLLRTLIDALPDLIHVKDLDGRYMLSNAAHMRYCGVQSEGELLGKTPEEADLEMVVTSYIEDTHLVLVSGQPVVHVERQGLNARGEQVWLQTTKVPLRDGSNKMMGIVSIATDITQRKRDEERIRASEERLRAVVTSAPVFIFAVDHDYNLTFFEGQGVDEGQIGDVGRVLGESLFVPAQDGASELEVADAVKQAFAGESIKTSVTVPPLTFDIRYSPIYDLEGAVTGVTGVATDISERVLAENALRESEARNRALLDAMPDMIFVIDRDGRFVDFDVEEDAKTVLPHDDILNHGSIYDIGHSPEALTSVQTAIAQCLQTGMLQTVEYDLQQNGDDNTFEGRLVRLNANEVLAVVRDVTEARQAQAEVRRREGMYRTLARNLPNTAVMLFDHDLRYLIAEGPALATQGYQGVEGKLMPEALPANVVKLVEPLYRRALAGETVQFEFPPQPYPLVFDCTLLPLRNDAGTIYAGMLVVRDVTEDHRKTQALQQYAEDLAQSNAELEQFAYVASHDLQEPLRKIQAFGGRLQQQAGDALDDTAEDYLARMLNAAERMQTLVQALLTLSQVVTKARAFSQVDLNAIVQGVLDDLELRIEQTGAQITVAPLPTLEAEPHQMRQLFQNLIGNALKYAHTGRTPQIVITSSTDDTDNTVHITVRDNGIGFAQRYAERIFGVFQRLHNRRDYDGAGIGLAICRKIVERHNGSIVATGAEGEGATFTVMLPQQQPTVPPPVQWGTPEPDTNTSNTNGSHGAQTSNHA